MAKPQSSSNAKLRPLSPLAAWLRAQVDQHGWTQVEFAEAIGVSQGTASKWLRGTMEPTLESMQRIAEVFYVSFDDVLDVAGIRTQVVSDPPQLVRILHKLRRIEPSDERFKIIDAILDVMLEMDAISRPRRPSIQDRSGA